MRFAKTAFVQGATTRQLWLTLESGDLTIEVEERPGDAERRAISIPIEEFKAALAELEAPA